MIHSRMKKLYLFLFFGSLFFATKASYIFIPMDEKQANHLKAYGIAYYAIEPVSYTHLTLPTKA